MHSSLRSSRFRLFLLLTGLLVATGCGGDDTPRPTGEITGDIQSLPALYRTTSGKDVIAAGNEGDGGQVFVDHTSGELAWRVWECHNPECPASSGGPNLFICPNPDYSVNANGTINYGVEEVEEGGTILPDKFDPGIYCPECAESRNFQTESNEQRQQYAEFILPHVLPETAARQTELENEIVERQRHVEERQRQNAAGGQ